ATADRNILPWPHAPAPAELPLRGDSSYSAVAPTTQVFAPNAAFTGAIASPSPGNIGLRGGGGGSISFGAAPAPAGPEVTRKPMDVTFDVPAIAANAAVAAPPAGATAPQPDSDVVKMDAFTVSASREGYAAAISA